MSANPAGEEKSRSPADGRALTSGTGTVYFADFNDVRRQRVQTSAFVSEPFSRMVNGWRFGW